MRVKQLIRPFGAQPVARASRLPEDKPVSPRVEASLFSQDGRSAAAEDVLGLPYKTEPGDTVASVARKWGVSEALLRSVNSSLPAGGNLAAGTLVRLPSSATALETAGYPYRLEAGDTWASVSRKFGIPENELLQVNSKRDPKEPLAPGELLALPVTANTKGKLAWPYQVKAGDTWQSVCRRFAVTQKDLLQTNDRLDPSKPLVPGELLALPDNATTKEKLAWPYQVKPGDTLQSVLNHWGISKTEFLQVNESINLLKPLEPGQLLALPAGATEKQKLAWPYKSESGDTVHSVAQMWGVSLETLLQVNEKLDPAKPLPPGSLVSLPEGAYREKLGPLPHLVKPGEGLGDIAAQHGTTLKAIAMVNPHRNFYAQPVQPGELIALPYVEPPPPPPPPQRLTNPSNPYYDEFVRAARKLELPDSWANNPAILAIVAHESGFNPNIKNPSATAFGLFQMIDSTWASYVPEVPHGTTDPYWQAVGAFRYISDRYGTPERAWAFWQATANKNPSLAPADLRGQANYWIARNWAGY